MNILFVVPTMGTGGAERVVSILSNALVDVHNVEIFTMEESSVDSYSINSKIQVVNAGIRVKRGNKLRTVLNYCSKFVLQRRLLKHEIRKFGADIVISFLPKADFLVYSLICECSFRWIPSERNDPMSRSHLERAVLNHIYSRSDALVCQTGIVAAYYETKGAKNTIVIKNPVIQHPDIDKAFSPNDKYIIAVGRLDKQKNYKMLIQAFCKAKQSIKFDEKLYILGDGPQREELETLICELKMTEYVYLLGRKTNVYDYLSKASAYIMSSNYEGLPNALLEAMTVGVPVISTDFYTGAARELIDKENGIIVPVGDVDAMSDAIIAIMLKNQNQRKVMGEFGMKKIVSFSSDEITGQWNKVIESLCNGR